MNPIECPNCQGTMRVVRDGSVEIDVCPHCDGIWFDLDEVERYFREKHPEKIINPFNAEMAGGTKKAECPRCKALALEPGWIDSKEVKKCGVCHGIFWKTRGDFQVADKEGLGLVLDVLVSLFGIF